MKRVSSNDILIPRGGVILEFWKILVIRWVIAKIKSDKAGFDVIARDKEWRHHTINSKGEVILEFWKNLGYKMGDS